jgi:hypothetical protein
VAGYEVALRPTSNFADAGLEQAILLNLTGIVGGVEEAMACRSLRVVAIVSGRRS